MKHNLEKRLGDLERQHAGPVEYKLVWADDNEPVPPGTPCIRLKWADDP